MIMNEEDMIDAIIGRDVWKQIPATKKLQLYSKLKDIKKIVKSEILFS